MRRACTRCFATSRTIAPRWFSIPEQRDRLAGKHSGLRVAAAASRAHGFGIRLLVDVLIAIGEGYDLDEVKRARALADELADSFQRDAAGLSEGVAVGAGRDGRKGDAFAAVLGCKGERLAIAAGQQLGFASLFLCVNRADGMDHVPGGKAIAAGDFGFASTAAAQLPAFLE